MSNIAFRGLTGFLLVLCISFPRAESSPQDNWRPEPPDLTELAVLEELASFVSEETEEVSVSYHLPSRVRQLISEESESFEVFRGLHPQEAHEGVLQTLPFGNAIFAAAREHELDALLLAAVVEAESNFVPTVVSPVGAVGLTQVMPSTATDYGEADLENPEANLKMGARYLKDQLRRFGGNVELALAAYNAGPYAVTRHDGVPPYRETRRYVEKVLSIYVDHHQSLWQESEARELLLRDQI